MKNKLSNGLLSANSRHLIVDRFKATTGVFASFFRKNDVCENNKHSGDYIDSPRAGEVLKHLFRVISGHFFSVIRKHLFSVINSDEKVIHREI